MRVFGKEELSWISVLVEEVAQADATVSAITSALDGAHHIHDFRVFNKTAAIEAQDRTQSTLTLLLAFTAAISLFVGGIGVMNVMLMTVTERTREIGIRMAVGASVADILLHSLTEAMLIAGTGGFLGALAGIGAGVAVAFLLDMPVLFSGLAIAGAMISAFLSGLIFGLLPAVRAARLDPFAALARH